jgi:hypothetical protein
VTSLCKQNFTDGSIIEEDKKKISGFYTGTAKNMKDFNQAGSKWYKTCGSVLRANFLELIKCEGDRYASDVLMKPQY